MWIKLEDGLYLFGEHGINRIEEEFDFNKDGDKVAVGVRLYRDTKHIASSKKTVERIQELLEQYYGY